MPIQHLNTITLFNGLYILKQARNVKAVNIYKPDTHYMSIFHSLIYSFNKQ